MSIRGVKKLWGIRKYFYFLIGQILACILVDWVRADYR